MRRSAVIVAGSLVLATTAACGAAAERVVIAHGSDRYPNTTSTDWVTYADHVVVVEAIEERALPLAKDDADSGEGSVDRVVTLQPREVVWSSPDPRHAAPVAEFDWNAWGWALQEGERIPMAGEDEPRVEVGHTYLMALVWHPAIEDEPDQVIPARWVGLGADAVIPADDGILGIGELAGAVRSSPLRVPASDVNYSLEDEFAGKTIDDFVERLESTKPSVREDFGPVTEES